MTFTSIATNPYGYTPQLIAILIAVALVEIVLKGFAMWRAARLNKLTWFIAILIINSAGILPIIYLLISKKQYKDLQAKPAPDVPSV